MLLEALGLSKKYGQFTALEDCSFQVERGEILGLLGPNGAGKTTLLRMLLGFLKPSSGNATVDGLDCYHREQEVHQRLSYLPGDARLPRKLSGRDVLRFFARLHPASSEATALEIADRLALDHSRPVKQMSTGMRQKLALAVTLAPDVPLVILDEPTANLDPSARNLVVQLLREARSNGKTILFSSHVLPEVEAISDRVLLLREGKLVETLKMSEIRQQHRIHAQLTGPISLPNGELAGKLEITQDEEGTMLIQTAHPLEPLLGWLAEQPLQELRIEPLGLNAIYERHHSTGDA